MPDFCATCGAAIPMQAPGGQCPLCLLSLASALDLGLGTSEELLSAGQVREFGKYELLEELARGGMGVVYHAKEIQTGRTVAVKMILTGQLASPEAVARFYNEAGAAKKLDHPNIVPVYEVGEFETQHYFAMRFIPGKRNIAKWAGSLPKEGRFQAVARAMAKVARAVAFAHERGVLHRDLKPSNILMDETDEPLVTDFGLAKLLDDEVPTLTLSNAILGSPSYMAPEQADPRGREITTATDVYGLGAVLFELVSGQPPFAGPSPLIVARRVVEGSVPRLTNVPQDLAILCRKCLSKNPHARYASALALAEDLERFSRGQPIEARGVSAFAELRSWARRQPVIASLLAALLLALVSGLAGVLWQWRRAEHANTNLRASITQLEWRQVVRLLEHGDDSVGMAQLARLLREDPQNPRAASLAISALEQCGFATPAAPLLTHGPSATILQARFSPDETRIATAGTDGTARLWEAATSRPLGAPLQHGGPVRWVEFSTDGRRVATASDDKTARIWDAHSGQPMTAPLQHEGPVVMARFSGNRLATISTDGTARLWPEHGEPLTLALGAPGRVLAWSPDGLRLFTGTAAGVKVWDTQGHELFAKAGGVTGLAPSPDGTRLAGWNEKELWMWDAATGADSGVKLEELSGGLLNAAWSLDSKRLAGAAGAGWARVWDAATGRALTPQMKHLYACACVAFSPDGRTLISGGHDGVARRWDASTGAPLSAPLSHPTAVVALEFSPSGTRLLAVAHSWGFRAAPRAGTAQSWDMRSRNPRPWRFRPGGNCSSVAWSSDGRRWATWAVSGLLSIHENGKADVTLPSSKIDGWARGMGFLPDGRHIYAAGTTGEISVWSLDTGERSLGPLLTGAIEGVRLFPDGRRLAIGGLDGSMAVWDLSTGAILVHLPPHHAPVNGIAISPDGKLLASAGEDGRCIVSDANTGQPLFSAIQLEDEIVSVQFSHDGRWIVTASHDRTVRQWDAQTGVPRGPEMRHDGEVVYAEFNRDDTRILSADRDGNARLWSALTGEPVTEPLRHESALRHACFSPDGRRFATEDHDGLRIWETATGEPLTLRQPHHSGIGIGFDSPSECVLFSPDGESVIHGTNTTDVLLWNFPSPPAPAPGWLPDLLEAMACLSVSESGEMAQVTPAKWLDLREKLRAMPGDDFYAKWAREYAGEPF